MIQIIQCKEKLASDSTYLYQHQNSILTSFLSPLKLRKIVVLPRTVGMHYVVHPDTMFNDICQMERHSAPRSNFSGHLVQFFDCRNFDLETKGPLEASVIRRRSAKRASLICKNGAFKDGLSKQCGSNVLANVVK